MSSGSFKIIIYNMCLEIIYFVYMDKKDLIFNLQWWTCYKTKRNETKTKSNANCLFPGKSREM